MMTKFTEYEKSIAVRRADWNRLNRLMDIEDFAKRKTRAKNPEGKPDDRVVIGSAMFPNKALLTLVLLSDETRYRVAAELEPAKKDAVTVDADDPLELDTFLFVRHDGTLYDITLDIKD